MKHTRTVILSAILTLCAFAGVTYTSCTRDKCKNASCLNGGVCSDGNCICKDGYTGLSCEIKNTSYIHFYNRTFTPITIVVNNKTRIIDTGTFLEYGGYVGDSISGYASTRGTYGETVRWTTELKYTFPARGTVDQDLSVPAEYFFLKAKNNNATNTVTQYFVNFNIPPDSTIDIVSIPKDGKTYWLGYYKARNVSKIRFENYPFKYTFDTLYLPMKVNQGFLAVIP